jgi:quercetin dioxygenase-like cupin family protein
MVRREEWGMSDGLALGPGGGRRIRGGGIEATVKITGSDGALTSTFEVVVPPGYDVGAHVHRHGQEIFYVLEGELEILAFEPLDRAVPDWHDWRSATGETVLRGGPGAFLWVPEGVPHAFGNPTDRPARMFFQSSVPGGHEHYFDELAALLAAGAPDPAAVAALRDRYDIDQITALADGR